MSRDCYKGKRGVIADFSCSDITKKKSKCYKCYDNLCNSSTKSYVGSNIWCTIVLFLFLSYFGNIISN